MEENKLENITTKEFKVYKNTHNLEKQINSLRFELYENDKDRFWGFTGTGLGACGLAFGIGAGLALPIIGGSLYLLGGGAFLIATYHQRHKKGAEYNKAVNNLNQLKSSPEYKSLEEKLK